ncbi:UvrD-helicase domain-containing protein [Pseudoflavonifractor phocaeensis]|uniref:UvrD-helicase domain-containing protein n=1 Tax=Pseudoflavonifractor phocaeensis TaxID=1870988 RepID=UPI001F2029CD|nr:UvrD-helicase domain-containing protein [Pseudoflavonifractor phocaeensis]MCF2660970.1 UvrD-helicase domain-containing protein [Pseudoflavonifractor phocaeensis]
MKHDIYSGQILKTAQGEQVKVEKIVQEFIFVRQGSKLRRFRKSAIGIELFLCESNIESTSQVPIDILQDKCSYSQPNHKVETKKLDSTGLAKNAATSKNLKSEPVPAKHTAPTTSSTQFNDHTPPLDRGYLYVGRTLFNREGTPLKIHDIINSKQTKSFVALRPGVDGTRFAEIYQFYQVGRDIFLSLDDISKQKPLLRKDERYIPYFNEWDKSSRKIKFSKTPVPTDLPYEKEHFTKIKKILQESLHEAINQHGNGSLAKAEFFASRGDNDFFRTRKLINDQLDEPFFARLDYNQENGVYIGKNEIANHVIDWTDERAALYYDYQLYIKDESCGLSLVRNYEISNQELSAISDLYVESAPKEFSKASDTDSEGNTGSTIADPYLLKVLQLGRNTKKIHDIIRSIQSNQYRIITNPFRSNTLVVGCAGSGKTMILYHRIRYILRNDTSIKPENITIISPTGTLNIESDILTETLHLDGIKRFSTLSFYKKIIEDYLEKVGCYYLTKDISPSSTIPDDFSSDLIKEFYSSRFLDGLANTTFKILDRNNSVYERFVLDSIDDYVGLLKVFFVNANAENLEDITTDIQFSRLLKLFQDANKILKLASPEAILNELRHIDKEIQVAEEHLSECNSSFSEQLQKMTDEILDLQKRLSNEEGELADFKQEKEVYNKTGNIGSIVTNLRSQKSISQKRKSQDVETIYEEELLTKQGRVNKTKTRLERLERERNAHKQKPIQLKLSLDALRSAAAQKKNRLTQLVEADLLTGSIKTVDFAALYSFFDVFHSYNTSGQLAIEECASKKTFSSFEMLCEIKQNLNAFFKFQKGGDKAFYLNQAFEYAVKREKEQYGLDPDYRYHFELFAKAYTLFSHIGALEYSEKFFFIDEFQDYNPTELSLFSQLFPNGVFNYYGDFLQCINPKGIGAEDALPTCMHNIERHRISENYRNALEITEYINKTFDMNMLAIGIPGQVFFSDRVSFSQNDLASDDRLAIIYSNESLLERYNVFRGHPTFYFWDKTDCGIKTGVINVLHVQQAKGLEFESVNVILEDMTENEQYVAMTRALSSLVIIKSEE